MFGAASGPVLAKAAAGLGLEAEIGRRTRPGVLGTPPARNLAQGDIDLGRRRFDACREFNQEMIVGCLADLGSRIASIRSCLTK